MCAGDKQSTVNSIVGLLKKYAAGDLIAAIDAYSLNGMNADKEYRYRPHNFFGRASYFTNYLSSNQISGDSAQLMDRGEDRDQLTATEKILSDQQAIGNENGSN